MAFLLDDDVLACADPELANLITTSPSLEQHPGIVLLSDRYLAKAYDAASLVDTIAAVQVARCVI